MRRSPRLRPVALALVGALALGATAAGSGATEPPRKRPAVRLLVSFERDASQAAQDEVADDAGTVVREIPQLDVRVVDVPAARARGVQRRLLHDDRVRRVEADSVYVADYVPQDTAWSTQAPTANNVNLPAAWDISTGDANTVIAIVDTGVTPTSPELPSGTKVLTGRNILSNNAATGDNNGHGTASAAVAAMVANNNSGASGACWQCRILPVKALDANGTGSAAEVAAGIVWAADNGADVISLSLSGTSSNVVKNAVDYAEGKGKVVVASAGNNSSSTPAYPAAHPTVLGVAASTLTNGPAYYTNFGSWVKLAAPGTNLAVSRTGSVISFSGTSSAAPLVSGIVGLLLSEDPNLSPAQIRAILMNSALDVSYVSTAGGRVNARAALDALQGSAPTTPPPPVDAPDTPAPSPGTPTEVIGGGWTASGLVTRTLTVRGGAPRFEARCSWCAGMTLEIIRDDGTVVATTAGDQRFVLTAPTLAEGTYFFRIRTQRPGSVGYFITYNQ